MARNWKIVNIKELFNVETGSTPSTNISEYWNGKIKWITPKDLGQLNSAYISDTERKITENGLKNCSSKIIPKSSIIISTRAPIGYIAILGEEMAFNQGCKSLVRKSQDVFYPFFYYLLLTKVKEMNRLGSGATFKEISKSQIENLSIPFPPLSTQHKIVEILEEADNLRKLRRQADEKMKALIPSLFAQMFGDPWKEIKDWKIVRIEEICEVETGSTPSTNVKGFWDAGTVKWITPTDLSKLKERMTIKDTARKITNHALIKTSLKIIPKGSIIISTRAPIGYIATLKDDMTFNQGCKGLIIKDHRKVDSYYLAYALLAKVNEMQKLGHGSTFKEISKYSISNLKIPLPPLPLQQEFAKLVEDIEAEKARQAESKKKLDELFNSLMQRAFTGKLVA